MTVPSSRSSSLSIIFRGQRSIDRWTEWLIPGAHFISINPSPKSSVSVSPQNSACSGMIKSHLNQFWNSSFHNIRRMCIPRFFHIIITYIFCHCPWSRSIYYLFRDRSHWNYLIKLRAMLLWDEEISSHDRVDFLTSPRRSVAIKWSCYINVFSIFMAWTDGDHTISYIRRAIFEHYY